MRTLYGARWWSRKKHTPVELLVAAEEGEVLIAVGSGNYVAMRPALARDLAAKVAQAADEALQQWQIVQAGRAGEQAAETALAHALADTEGAPA